MVKKQVKYTDYEGKPQETTVYFNLSKFEWLQLETYTKGGLIENLNNSMEVKNIKKTIAILTKIILTAYGEKDDDGVFVKSDEAAVRFSKTEVFSELFYELAYSEAASEEFFMGLIPADLKSEAQRISDERKKLG